MSDLNNPSRRIRPYRPSDEADTVNLIHLAGLGQYPNDPLADIRRIHETDGGQIFILESDDRLIGCIVASFDGRRGWVYYLAVHPDEQTKGLGRDLMVYAEAWLKQQGAPKVLLLIRDVNRHTADFYAKLGYSEEPCFCMGRWLDTPPQSH
ncbi:GNAT family N-acetyltransferase [Parachitinimonas caeni]|uniref:GNAT family N-acetyltransferase n=1 Tax=Parachitinimonas caeni TaxID=3031301 RepID=A0ABT7DVJ4_9NEIS|nr:GNAT family N-acetyltransferase [Parachitinimonas caeni]MDK2124084.1 GNAT family N-acetyltransferase [Parachitinimonas caeni]